MSYVFAILGMAAGIVLWALFQRADGRSPDDPKAPDGAEGGCSACSLSGVCSSDSCEEPGEVTAVQR